MKRVTIILFTLLALTAQAQVFDLGKFGIKAAHYSGIAALGGTKYAVVTDKDPKSGFYIWDINIDTKTGEVTNVTNLSKQEDANNIYRDVEGICYCPKRNTVWISGEEDQRVLEHTLDGKLTGKELAIPEDFGRQYIQDNRGFEPLGHDTIRHLFWTTTEDNRKADQSHAVKLLEFNEEGQYIHQYDYHLDEPQAKNDGRFRIFGVVAITPLPNGKLMILEREARIAPKYNGSKCWCKLFDWSPTLGEKRLVDSWVTKFSVTNVKFANYEGMCLGPVLEDGRQTLLLISDSQGGMGKGRWHLHDWLKVITL